MAINHDFERESDVLDQANQATELFTEAGRSASAKALEPERHPDFDGKHCVECGDEIPDARLVFMRVRCVVCQEQLERRAKFVTKG